MPHSCSLVSLSDAALPAAVQDIFHIARLLVVRIGLAPNIQLGTLNALAILLQLTT